MRRPPVAALILAAAALAFAGAALAADRLPLAGGDTLTVSDVVIGQAKTGPYNLSWNHIAAATVSVSVNGRLMLRRLDYEVDAEAGAITFTKALARSNVARVSYAKRPGASQPNAVSLRLPIIESRPGPLGSTVGAAYLYQRSPSHADVLTHGFTAALRGESKAELTGAVLLNDPTPQPAGFEAPRRVGWRLAGKRDTGRLALSGSLSRADQGLVGGGSHGLKAGVRTLDMAATYRAADDLTAGATYACSSNLTSPAGARTRATGYGLAYQPARAPSLGLAHQTTVRQEGESSSVEQKTDYTFLYKAGAGLSVGASLCDLEREGGADEATAQYAVNYSGSGGLSLAAARISRSRQAEGSPVRAVTDRLALNARLGSRSAAKAAHEIQHTSGGRAAATRLDLTTAFIQGVDLQAFYLTSAIGTPQTISQAGFKVTALPKTQLSGRVGMQRTGAGRTDLVGLDANVSPSAGITVGGAVTRRTHEADILDTRKAHLSFTAGQAVKLTGEYAENPTDDAGRPLLAARSKAELTTQFGPLSVGGSAARQKDTTGRESAVYEAQVGICLGGDRELYTGYRRSSALAPDNHTQDSVYRVGYNHHAGDDFSMSLEAQMLLYQENERIVPQRTEHRAQAAFNARF